MTGQPFAAYRTILPFGYPGLTLMGVKPIHIQALAQTSSNYSAQASGRIVYVPSSGLSCFTLEPVQVPRRYLAQALPALLEDQLCEPADKLHICWGQYQRGKPLPVIVVQQSLMQEWLDAVAVSGIKASALVPDFYSLPCPTEGANLYWDGDYGIVRTGEHSGFSGGREEVENLLKVAFSGQKQYCYETYLPSVDISKAINLRQGKYALPVQWKAFYQPFAWPLGLAAALLICISAYFHISGNDYQQQNTRLQQANANIHQQLFNQEPDSNWLARARYQVQLARRQLSQQNMQQWHLLQQVNQLMARCKSCIVNGLDMNQKSVVLTLLDKGSESLLQQLAKSSKLELALTQRTAEAVSITIRLKEVS